MLARASGQQEIVRLQLMGDVRARSGGGADLTPRSRKGLALVAILALTPGNSAGRDRVLGLLWGDRGEEQARASLRQTVVDLKTTAPDVGALVLSTRQSLALQPGGWTCDVSDLEHALDARDPALLAAQLQTIRGELLQSLHGLTDSLDDWLLAERAGRRDRLVAVGTAIAQAPGTEAEAARQLATALMLLDPGNEELCRLGMRLDSAQGDLAALHRRYRVLEEQLTREFTAKPSPETTRLLRDLTAIRPAAAALGGSAAVRVVDKAEPPLLLVTPLSPLDETRETQSIGMILSEELETTLARYRELRVLAVPRPDPERLEALTHGAVASYMLGGSIRSADTNVRVNVRLSDVATGRVVWSRRVDIAGGALGAAVDELVDRVVGAVLPAVQRDLGRDARSSAYNVLYGGRELLFGGQDYAAMKAAADQLEEAIDTDPRHVPAMLRLSHLYNTDFRSTIAGHDHRPLRARAYELRRGAVRLDPESAQAHAALGWSQIRARELAAAASSFERAVELMPLNAEMIETTAFGYVQLGDLDRADDLLQRAFRLNPFPSADYFADSGIILMMHGKHAEAVWHLTEHREPTFHYAAMRIAALALSGNVEDALRDAEQLRRRFAVVWQGSGPADDDAMCYWLNLWMPLTRAEHEAVFQEGLAKAGICRSSA